MSNSADALPIYGPGNALLGYVSLPSAERMLMRGHAVSRGTKRRVRALVVVRDNFDLIPSDSFPAGQRYSHQRETRDNPKGVWAFRKLTLR